MPGNQGFFFNHKHSTLFFMHFKSFFPYILLANKMWVSKNTLIEIICKLNEGVAYLMVWGL